MASEIETESGTRRTMLRDTEEIVAFYSDLVESPGLADEYWREVVSALNDSRFYETPEESDASELVRNIPFNDVEETLESTGFVNANSDITIGRGDQITIWGAGRNVLNATAQDLAEQFSGLDSKIQQNSGRRERYSSRNPLHRSALQPAVWKEEPERYKVANSPPDGTSLDEIGLNQEQAESFREAVGLDPNYNAESLTEFYWELTEDQGFNNSGDITETSGELLSLLFDADIYPIAVKAKVGDVNSSEAVPADLGDGKSVATTYLSLEDSRYETEFDGEQISVSKEQVRDFGWLGGPANYVITLPAATLAGFCWMQPKGIDPDDSLYQPLVELEERTGEEPWPWAGLGYYGSGSQLPQEYTRGVSDSWPGKNGSWDPSEQGVGQKVSILCSLPYSENPREVETTNGSFKTAERAEEYFQAQVESVLDQGGVDS